VFGGVVNDIDAIHRGALLGTVFDVSHKLDVYGLGKSYNIFAGKDGSKGLGMSSLQPENAIPDYSGLDESDRKVLDDWYDFFSYVYIFSCVTLWIFRGLNRLVFPRKRYNIVGKVIDLPAAVASL